MSVGDEQMDEIERLRQENAAIRQEMGVAAVSSGRPDTLERLEKENEMLRNQKNISDDCAALLETEEGRHEALFCLQFFRSIPLPLWVSRLNRKIAYWNDFAERTYQYPRKRALGKDFIDLFVSEAEQGQAKEDLVSIIFGEEGAEHFNLCKDKDKQGRQVVLVTCCFPVFDPRLKEFVQAELSFDLRQLDALQAELDEMYSRHRKKEEEERAFRLQREGVVIKNLIDELFAELRQYCERERTAIQRRIAKNRELIEAKRSTELEKNTHRAELVDAQNALSKLDQWDLTTQREIASVSTVDEHKEMKTRLWEATRKDV